jgi:hypothetical protein
MIKQLERQYPLTAVFEVTKFDLDGTNPLVVGTLPSTAIILGGFVETVEAFDVSDMTISAPGAITFATVTSGSTGRTNGTAPGMLPNGVDVTVTPSAGTDTTGKMYVVIEYVLPRRQNEVQP